MTARGRRAAVHLSAAALLAGCSLSLPLPPPEPAMTAALIDQVPADVPQGPRSAHALLVLAPQARPAYDTQRMAYSLRPHHIAYYSRNEWAETPPQMLQPLLVRALEATGRFQAVLAPPQAGATALTLQAEVLELLQDFAQQPPVLRLVVRVQLVDAVQHLVASREFTARQPLAEASPAGGVRAANEATAQVLREVAGFVAGQAR